MPGSGDDRTVIRAQFPDAARGPDADARGGETSRESGVLARALEVLAAVVARLPFGALRAFGAGLGLVAWAIGIRRAHVLAAMHRAGIARAPREARRMYRALGIGVFELLWARGRDASIAPLVDIDEGARAALARARGAGRGIVFAASHTGNWELAAFRLAEDGELLVVTKPLSVSGFHAFAGAGRARRGVRTVNGGRDGGRDGAITRALETLGREGSVAMLIDQVPLRRSHAVVTHFLGAQVHVDRAAAAVALRAGAPLVVAASRRNADGTHRLSVLGVHEPPPRSSDDAPAWVERITVEATRALEQFVREHPSEWLWLHRRWAAPAP